MLGETGFAKTRLALKRRRFLTAVAAGGAAGGVATFAAPSILRAQEEPIRIGEINSYTRLPAFLEPYRQGWTLAMEQVNANGGALGRQIETIHRDDGGNPEDAVRLAGELIDAENVDLLAGGFFSHVGLAISAFAAQNQRLFVASEPLTDALVWSQGNRYTFRLRPSTYVQCAMLVEEAAKLPATRWATIAPNYEYGQSAVHWFKELLTAAKPDVTFVAEQFPALGSIDAGAEVQALASAEPEGIFNVTFGNDLINFVRQGNTRGLFEDREVVSLLTGEPEYIDPLADEAPEGWIVTGYPWYDIDTPEHDAFLAAYRDRWDDYPRLGSVVGYSAALAVAHGIDRAGTTENEAVIDEGMKGLVFDSPFGPVTFRAVDHQSTMGAFIGRTGQRDGVGVMVDWRYADGADYLPPDDVVSAMRPDAT